MDGNHPVEVSKDVSFFTIVPSGIINLEAYLQENTVNI